MSAQNIAAITTLTPAQEGILFHVIRDGARGAYQSQFSAVITGALDHARWREAWEAVVARHDALRTLFTWDGRDKPLQIVRERVVLPWQTLDWRELDATAQDDALADWLARDRDLGFVLEQAPLLRCALIRTGPDQHRFNLSFHHLIMDGWSMRLAMNDARRLYSAPRSLGTPAPSFTTFVDWLKDRDDKPDAEFWREQLSDFDTPTFPDVATESATVHETHVLRECELAPDLVTRLNATARARRVTMNSLVSAAYALTLGLYTDRDDLVFGTTVAGRPPDLAGVEETVGLFINTLPLRIRLAAQQTVREVIEHVHAEQVGLRAREQSSAPAAARLSGVASGQALFESILVYESFPAADVPAGGPDIEIDRFVEFSHYPLAVLVVPDNRFQLIGIADPHRLDGAALDDFLHNLVNVLERLPDALEQPLVSLALLNQGRQERVTGLASPNGSIPGPNTTLLDDILAHAASTPNAIALVDDALRLTYGDLAQRAIADRDRLRRIGVSRGDVVMVSGARSATTVAALPGILAAGAAYCPVAPDLAPQRLAQMADALARDGRRVFALVSSDANALPDSVSVLPLADLLHTHAMSAPGSRLEPISGPEPSDTAYIMFTSGSTGTPKGVVISHRALAHSVRARDGYYSEPPRVFGMLSALSTDSAMAGLFWTLGRGGALALPTDRAEQDVDSLMSFLRAHAVTHILTVPSLYAELLPSIGAVTKLRTVIVAGEACPDTLVSDHHAQQPQLALHNEYGPTETTIWCSATSLAPNKPVRIGAALSTTRLYVTDRHGRLLPPGVAGELCVAGPQLADGYAGDPEQTAARFVASTLDPDGRVYRTGDRVRWHRDGQLSFVGRVDDQIKVRGFRIEPGEVEHALRGQSVIDEAVVVLHNGQRLVAWLLGDGDIDPAHVKAQLAERLPAYMIPAHLEQIDEWPRTPAGKIDRRALAVRDTTGAQGSVGRHVSPESDVQRTLAAIWCDVLNLESVGIHDDFFALGGDSLLSIRVLARSTKAGLSVSPADFFAQPTIAAQASAAAQRGARRAPQKPAVGPQPLMPIQRWFFEHIDRGTAHWNLSYRFALAVEVTLRQLARAIAAVVTHHDALRTRFTQQDTDWRARQLAPFDVNANVVVEWDLRMSTNTLAEIDARATQLNATLALDTPPLMRVALVRTPGGEPDGLVIVLHHLVVDAESWRIVIEDLEAALIAVSTGTSPALPPRTDALALFSKRLETWSAHADFETHARAWCESLAGPFDELTPSSDAFRATEADVDTMTVALSIAQTAALSDAGEDLRASLFELLIAGVARALGTQLSTTRVRLELEGHGRDPIFDDVDVSRTVGWFTTAYPLVVHDDNGFGDSGSSLRAVKRAVRRLPDRGQSYGLIMGGHVNSDDARAIRAKGRASVLFNFLGQHQSAPTEDTQAPALALVDERCGQARAADAPRAYPLEINARIDDGALVFNYVWPRGALSRSTVQSMAESTFDTLRELPARRGDTVVPEDFPLADLSADGLDELSDLLDDLDD
ncbi:MAG: amino acid adenylation domain-containing protein [Pseudomonadota bacterium]